MSVRPLAATGLDGNLLLGPRPSLWFELPPQPWNFTSPEYRDGVISSTGLGLASLVGHRIHWRVSHRPTDIRRWEMSYRQAASARRPFRSEWDDYIQATVDHVRKTYRNREAGGFSEKVVYLGVEPPGKSGFLRFGAARQIREGWAAEVTRIVADSGLEGRPLSQQKMEWLLHRSVGLGLPALVPPGVGGKWTPEDMAEFTEEPTYEMDPYDKTVLVTADRGQAHIAIGAVGRMEEPNFHDPWLARCDALDFPVETHVTLDVLNPDQAKAQVDRRIHQTLSQGAHWAAHNLPGPTSLGVAMSRAKEVRHEIETGGELDIRCRMWVRFACPGATSEEALARLAEVKQMYARTGISVHRVSATAIREFHPGERLYAGESFTRHGPVRLAAGALPTASALVGHPEGLYLGPKTGRRGKGPVFLDTHRRQTKENRSGTILFVGTPGAGKTTACGWIVAGSVLQGTTWVVLDPSGPLAGLTRLPRFAPFSVWVDLLDAAPGSLNTYGLYPEPDKADFDSEQKYRFACDAIAGDRRSTTTETLHAFLPLQLQSRDDYLVAIREAVDAVPADVDSSPTAVLDELHRVTDHGDPADRRAAKGVLAFLDGLAKERIGQLIFPTGTDLDYEPPSSGETRLTVITMRGLQLPKTPDPTRWTAAEAKALPVFRLAALRTEQMVFGMDRNAPKGAYFDEGWALSRSSSGVGMMDRFSRLSRAYNISFLLTSHTVDDILVEGVEETFGQVFAGFTQSPEGRRRALEIMNAPTGLGYEDVLKSLKTGEFLYHDGTHTDRMKFDLGWAPDIAEALRTTPDPDRIQDVA